MSIALLQAGRLGDMILTTPLFHALRSRYPTARITVFASENSAIVPESQLVVDRVIPLPHGLLRQIPLFARRMRHELFDLYIDIKDHRSTTSRVIADLIGAQVMIGHATAMKRHEHGIALPQPDAPGHYVDKALAPMKLLAPGMAFQRHPYLEIPLPAYRAVDMQLDPGDYGMVTLNVSAGDRSRYWPVKKWRELIAALARRYSVAVLSSPPDRALADEVCTMRKGARPIRTQSILEAAAVVDRSLAVISPDTSIIHVASARNRPCIGLYPPDETNARAFAPLSDRNAVIMPEAGEALEEIPVEKVLAVFDTMIKRRR